MTNPVRALVIVALSILAWIVLIALAIWIFDLFQRAFAVDDEPLAFTEVIEKRPQPTTTSTTTLPPTTTTTAVARTAPTVSVASVSRPSAGVPDSTWDAIARCESGGNWQDTRGGYEGGLHFLNSTWLRAGGARFAQHAYDATREQQIQVANEWLARTSWEQWPVCSRKVGAR